MRADWTGQNPKVTKVMLKGVMEVPQRCDNFGSTHFQINAKPNQISIISTYLVHKNYYILLFTNLNSFGYCKAK